MEKTEIQETLAARAQFYRMLSNLYFRPITQEEVDNMAEGDFADLRDETEDPLMAEGYDDIFRYLRKRNTGTRQELAEDFTSAFVGTKTIKEKQAMPYESLFRDESGLLMQGPRNEVYHTFKEASIEIKEGLNLPEDHLSFEFEFMAILCDRSSEAVDSDDAQAYTSNLKTQKKFFELHIASWFDEFYDRAMDFIQTRFYRGVLKLTKSFLQEEPATIDELLAQA